MTRKRNIVYSTAGNICTGCGRGPDKCICKPATASNTDGMVRLQRQSKGRGGKPVVIVAGLALDSTALKDLAKKLKAKCGVGGTIEDGNIVMQGDKRELIKSELEALGHTVKIAGG